MAASIPQSLSESLKNTKVDYRRLGTSGLRVSVPILGAMAMGSKSWGPWVYEEEHALPLLKAAYDRGVNTWDTANMYSSGVSEEIIGKALKQYDIPRQKVVIISKCCLGAGDEPAVTFRFHAKEMKVAKDYINRTGNSRQAIFNQVEDSLQRLQTTYLDVLLLHRFDEETPMEETMEALNDLVRWGKVRYIGASSMWATQFAQMQFCAEKHGWAKFVCMQNYYNLLYREEEREMIRYCNETGVGLIPWSPLAGGELARLPELRGQTPRSQGSPELSEASAKIVQRVKEIADARGWTMSTVAIAWLNKRVTSPILGATTLERLDEALEARGKTLTDEEEKSLEELYVPRPVVGHH